MGETDSGRGGPGGWKRQAQWSSRPCHRPQALPQHRATLVIAKLDRLARNVAIISNLMEPGVEFVAVDIPQANRFVVHILAAAAEQEAEAISKRQRQPSLPQKRAERSLAAVASRLSACAEIGAAARQVRSQKASQVRSELLPTIAAIQATCASSLRAIAADLNAREIPTPRRFGEWSAMQVQKMMERYRAAKDILLACTARDPYADGN